MLTSTGQKIIFACCLYSWIYLITDFCSANYQLYGEVWHQCSPCKYYFCRKVHNVWRVQEMSCGNRTTYQLEYQPVYQPTEYPTLGNCHREAAVGESCYDAPTRTPSEIFLQNIHTEYIVLIFNCVYMDANISILNHLFAVTICSKVEVTDDIRQYQDNNVITTCGNGLIYGSKQCSCVPGNKYTKFLQYLLTLTT